MMNRCLTTPRVLTPPLGCEINIIVAAQYLNYIADAKQMQNFDLISSQDSIEDTS